MDTWTDQSWTLPEKLYFAGLFGADISASRTEASGEAGETGPDLPECPQSWANRGEQLILWLGQAIAQANHARANLLPDRLANLGDEAAETVTKIQLDLLHAAREAILTAQQTIRDQFTVVGELVTWQADGGLSFGDFALVKGTGESGVCITSAAGTFLRTADGTAVHAVPAGQDLEDRYLPPSLATARAAGIG